MAACSLAAAGAEAADRPTWTTLSSKAGDLPPPGTSIQQTACLVLDVDKDGLNDIVVASRVEGASLAWYRREKDGWTIHPIDRGLNLEAGGASADIDGDGDLDLIFGEDYSGTRLYWWENPWPRLRSRASWTRREIESRGRHRMHHDQILGDFDGDGRDELAFWVQHAGDAPAVRGRRATQARRSLADGHDRAASGRPRGWPRPTSTATASPT